MHKRTTVMFCTFAAVGCLQAAQMRTPRFEGARALDDVRQLVSIGPRVAGSPGAQAARDYIGRQLKALGITLEEQAFEAATPLGRVHMVNLRAMLPGPQGAGSKGRLI